MGAMAHDHHVEYALITGDIGMIGLDNLAEVIYMPADPGIYNDAMRASDAAAYAIMGETRASPINHEVIKWVGQPEDPQHSKTAIPILVPQAVPQAIRQKTAI